jgi:DHA1 family bicyclomycin/chloramphenicol resistance-like MFS transporter
LSEQIGANASGKQQDHGGRAPPSTAEFVALCALLTSLVALSIDSMLPALTTIGAELGAGSANQAQFVISALFLGLGLGQMFYGPLADRFGRKPAIQVGLALFALGSILSIFATSFPMMLAGRVLQGLGVAGPRIVTVAMVRDRYAGAAMARIMSLVMALFLLVPTVAPAIGQTILLLVSWRWIFGFLLLVALIGWTWLVLRQPETLKPEHRRPFSVGTIIRGAIETFRNRTTAGYALAAGLVLGAFLGFLNTAAQMLQIQYALGVLFPAYFATLALTQGGASLLNSRLVMRFGMALLTRVAIVGVILVSSGFFVAAAAASGHPPFWSLMLYLMLIFFFVGLLFGNLNALAMEPLGHMAGIAASAIGTVTTFLAVSLGALIGLLYNGTVLPLVGGFAVLGTASFLAMRWVDRSDQNPSS